MLAKVAEGIAVEGMESLAPALVDGMESRARRPAPRAPTSSSATPSASAPAPTTSSPPAPSSSRPAGPTPPPATPCRSTCRGCSAPRRTGALADVREPRRCSTGRPWWTLTPFAGDDELAAFTDGDDDVDERFDLDTADVERLPRRHRPRRSPTCSGWVARRLAGRRRHRGPRPGPPRGRGARRARRRRSRLEHGRRLGLEPGIVHVTTGSLGSGFVAAQAAARGRHRDRPHRHRRAGRRRPRTCAGCRRAGATRSTRSSCGPATTSSTSSTASASSSR